MKEKKADTVTPRWDVCVLGHVLDGLEQRCAGREGGDPVHPRKKRVAGALLVQPWT